MNACWHIRVIVVIVQIQMIYFQYSECNSSYIFYYIDYIHLLALIKHLKQNLFFIFGIAMIFLIVASWWNKHLDFAAWNIVFYFTYFNLCNTIYSRVDTYSVIWLYITHAVICCPFPRFQFCHMRQMWL